MSCADVCNGDDDVFDSPIMQVMAQAKNVENIEACALKECEVQSNNIVIHGIPVENTKTHKMAWK